MSGFGQREGLTLSAKYSIPESRVKEFENMLQAQDAEWEPLPIPPEILKRIRFKFQSLNLQSTTGFFRCRTAGSNVLYEQDTSPCSNPKSWVMIEKDPPRWERQEVPLQSIDSFSDIILSMYEPNTRTFSASVKSGY